MMRKLFQVVKLAAIAFVLVSFTLPKFKEYKTSEKELNDSVSLTQSLTEELTPLSIELQGLKDKFSNESISVYNSNFEVADAVGSFTSSKLKKIVGYHQNEDGTLEEVVTAKGSADTEYFTDIIDKIQYVLKYSKLDELVQELIGRNIMADKVSVNTSKKLAYVTVASIQNGTVVNNPNARTNEQNPDTTDTSSTLSEPIKVVNRNSFGNGTYDTANNVYYLNQETLDSVLTVDDSVRAKYEVEQGGYDDEGIY